MPLPELVVPLLNNYRVLYQRDGPHEGVITAFKVDPSDRWILSASRGPSKNLLVLTDIRQGRVYGLVDMGPIWVTSIAWVDPSLFFLGCSNGIIYCCRLQAVGVSVSSWFYFDAKHSDAQRRISPVSSRSIYAPPPIITTITSSLLALLLRSPSVYVRAGSLLCAGGRFSYFEAKIQVAPASLGH